MRIKKKRKPPTEYDVMWQSLQFALQQVASGRAALRNPDIDERLRQRLDHAVRYWDSETVRLSALIDQQPSAQ